MRSYVRRTTRVRATMSPSRASGRRPVDPVREGAEPEIAEEDRSMAR
jgi:hypothetical protein